MNQNIKELKWIVTGGGPFVLIPSKSLPIWSGTSKIDSISKGIFEEANDILDPNESHYGFACSHFKSIAKNSIANDTVPIIVLGDESLSTTVVSNDSNETVYLVKILYNDIRSNMIVNSFLNIYLLELVQNWKEQFEIKLIDKKYTLMDAAVGVFFPADKNDNNNLEFELYPGTYSVSTAKYEPQKDMIAFELFKIKRID